MSRARYVLVGGRSARMGRDKALLPFRGVLVESVAREAAAAAASAVPVSDSSRYAIFGYPVIPDHHPGEGPVGCILTAVHHTTTEWNLVVAGPSELPEPLCAAYHRRSRSAIESAFPMGGRKVTAAFASLPVVMWLMAELAPFQKLNTPEDWSGYAAE